MNRREKLAQLEAEHEKKREELERVGEDIRERRQELHAEEMAKELRKLLGRTVVYAYRCCTDFPNEVLGGVLAEQDGRFRIGSSDPFGPGNVDEILNQQSCHETYHPELGDVPQVNVSGGCNHW